MLYLPGLSWGYSTSNFTTPSTSSFGTSITGSGTANVKGSYTQLLSALAEDAYMVYIRITDGNTNATGRDGTVDIGIDPAGGTSYSVLIPDLLASQAGASADGAHIYWFPVRIPAGATVAARTSQSVISATCRVSIAVRGKPSRPDLIPWGTTVTAFGVGASSNGTSITPGTSGADGTYVSLGTPSKPHFFWQVGFGINNATTTALGYNIDLARGDGSNKHLIISDAQFIATTTERMWRLVNDFNEGWAPAGAESTIYVRGSCSGTPVTGCTAIAYGVS